MRYFCDFYRKFKVQDAVPAQYPRDHKVLVGKCYLEVIVYIYFYCFDFISVFATQ